MNHVVAEYPSKHPIIGSRLHALDSRPSDRLGEGHDPTPRKLTSLIQLTLGRSPTALGMFAPMTTLLKELNVREDPEPLPLAFADPQSLACRLLAAIVSGKCITNLVQVHKLIVPVSNGPRVAFKQTAKCCRAHKLGGYGI